MIGVINVTVRAKTSLVHTSWSPILLNYWLSLAGMSHAAKTFNSDEVMFIPTNPVNFSWLLMLFLE